MTLPVRLPSRMLILAALCGLPLGVGVFTFVYAEGLSYFSSDPKACVNCHIMNDEYAGWGRASHHAVATCVDCHLPHALLPKLLAKGINGWNHSSGFTLQNFHEPIQITRGNARTLQENCLRCHGRFVDHILSGSRTDADAVTCVHCHRSVGHGQ